MYDAPALTDDAIARLERATLDAVAPARVVDQGDWLLAFDDSTISRAKSAVPLRHHGVDTSTLPGLVERYQQQGLAPLFRVADVPALRDVQEGLRRLGLAPTQPTLVQIARLTDVAALPHNSTAQIALQPSPDWGSVYTAPGFDARDGAYRRTALSRSPFVVYASVHHDGQPLAAGTASISQGWASIHGMRTVVHARGRGLASTILVGLAHHALERGMAEVFLQVEEENITAQSLYRRAGFTTVWRYHHWR